MVTNFIVPNAIIELAHRLIDMTRPVIRTGFQSGLTMIELKNDLTPVTEIDRACEQAIRTVLARERPEDGIWGEEYGRSKPNAEWEWIIDPIDGTKSFVVGQLSFGCLLGLHHKDRGFVLGIADQALMDMRWHAVIGQGAFLNGKKIKTQPVTGLSACRMSITNPLRLTDQLKKLHDQLTPDVQCIHYGGNFLNFARIADGMMHLSFESSQHIFDVAPFITLLSEAGGVITQADGREIQLQAQPMDIVAASDQRLHDQIIRHVKSIS